MTVYNEHKPKDKKALKYVHLSSTLVNHEIDYTENDKITNIASI